MSALAAQAMRRHRAAARPRQDPWLSVAFYGLLGLGVVMVYSASAVRPGELGGGYYLLRHLLHVGAGLLLVQAVQRLPVDGWQQVDRLLIVLGLGLLGLVLVPGLSGQVNGSARWFRLGPVQLQPSEFVKVIMVIYVAGYLTRRQDRLQVLSGGILVVGAVVGLAGMLLLGEPDFGSLVVIVLTVAAMLYLAGVRLWHLALCALAALVAMAALIYMAPYRLERILAFIDPWSNQFGSGFQLVQALIAFGRGEWLGVGLGNSVQKLYYLPAANTDFLLAVVGEELGLVGVWAVIGLFALLTWRALWIARRAELAGETFGARLAQGLAVLLAVQALVNMGVNLGVLPTKGLTLPLVSYGGSSMLASCLAVGLLRAVDVQTRGRRRMRA